MTYPFLHSHFLAQHKPSENWCTHLLSLYPEKFNETLVPLYEWDGLLFVGTPSPLAQKIEGHWRLVIAEKIPLKTYWENYFIKKTAPLNLNHSMNDDLLEGIHMPPSTSVAPEDPSSDLLTSLESLVKESHPANQTSESPVDASHFQSLEILPESKIVIENIKLKLEEEPSLETFKTSEEGSFVASPPPLPPPSPSSLALKENPDPLTTSQLQNLPQPPPPPPALPKNLEKPTKSIGLSPQANPIHKSETQKNETHLSSLIHTLRPKYESALLFKIIGDWVVLDSSFGSELPETLKDLKYDLSQASPFKVSMRSKHPYHGKWPPNALMEKLFTQDLQLKELPAHITLIPLLSNNKITGFLLTWSKENCRDISILLEVETQVQTHFNLNSAMNKLVA